jgi:hypothetical protein
MGLLVYYDGIFFYPDLPPGFLCCCTVNTDFRDSARGFAQTYPCNLKSDLSGRKHIATGPARSGLGVVLCTRGRKVPVSLAVLTGIPLFSVIAGSTRLTICALGILITFYIRTLF